MADLKNQTEESLVAAVQRAAESGKGQVSRAAEDAIAAIKDVGAARAALPERASELLASAVVAETFSFRVPEPAASYGSQTEYMGCCLDIAAPFGILGSHATERGCNGRAAARALEAGRYRALVFLVKVPE